MVQTVVRVVLAAVWLVIGAGLLGRGLLPDDWFAGRDPVTLNLMGLVALVLAVYNVLRLVVFLRRRRARARLASNPLRPQIQLPPREREYIPELDFTRNPSEGQTEEPRPSGSPGAESAPSS